MAAKELFDNDELFYLKWNNFQSNINNQFEKLRQTDDLVDITFACEGKKLGAHKLILFACSPYFKDLLQTNFQHSVFFMYGVRYEILKAIIEYMYLGEVHISNENLREFIQTAESLQIRGLTKDQAIKIPKPVVEVSASDLMGGPDEHYDHSLKRVVKRGIGGKRMRPNEENVIGNNHQMYVPHHEPIPVDMGNDGGGVNNGGISKPEIQMPKPIDKRHPYHEEGQVEPKMELEDSVDIPNYITHQRQMENQHQQHQQQQQQQQQQQHHHHHPHQPKILQPPPPPPQQQPPQVAPPHHIGAPNNVPPIIDGNYDRPGTSGHTGGPPQPDAIQPIKTGYEQMSENNQAQQPDGGTDEDTKFKLKREGTPKLTKCQESSRACPVCSRIYSSVSNLRQHMRLIHNPTYVCCPICQKYFNTDLYLRRHISGIHRGENIDWPPPYENNQTTPNSIC